MTSEESAYHDALRELGCIACRIDGRGGAPAEIHHQRTGAGAGQKSPHLKAIPLCAAHHRGTRHPIVPSIHLAPNKFISEYGTEAELHNYTRQALAKKVFKGEEF